jgi:hypothetical protein
VDAACDALVRSVSVTMPQPSVVSAMNDRYAAYTRLYPALRLLAHARHA